MIKKHGENMRLCTKHNFVFDNNDECVHCTYPEPMNSSRSLAVVHEALATERKLMATTVTHTHRDKVVLIAAARLTDPESSRLAAATIPTKKLWERMLIIRNLVLANPGQCIRWYTNLLAEQTPAPQLDAPGCRDSVGAPKHDVGFYGVWATLFAQAVKHGLIVKVTDPQMPPESLMKRSPYPGESMVHVYEACTPANMQRMEAERHAHLEGPQAQKEIDREEKAAAVAEWQLAKKVAVSVRNEVEAPLGTDAGQSGSWFQTL